MNNVESIFKSEITIAGLVEIFKTVLSGPADILDNSSCLGTLFIAGD